MDFTWKYCCRKTSPSQLRQTFFSDYHLQLQRPLLQWSAALLDVDVSSFSISWLGNCKCNVVFDPADALACWSTSCSCSLRSLFERRWTEYEAVFRSGAENWKLTHSPKRLCILPWKQQSNIEVSLCFQILPQLRFSSSIITDRWKQNEYKLWTSWFAIHHASRHLYFFFVLLAG